MTHALDAASIDLLEVLQDGAMRMQDSRVNPLLVLDLFDDGLVEVDSKDASLSLTAKGRCLIQTHAD
jgi:hypothetical protein